MNAFIYIEATLEKKLELCGRQKKYYASRSIEIWININRNTIFTLLGNKIKYKHIT